MGTNDKPDSSFFRKITIGVVGTRAVCRDLSARGHDVRELERGALDTKLWKEVKRKRVRIPDLVCLRCGMRLESRAKTGPKLSMSHSDEEERAWSFGMVDSDIVAFPVCEPVNEAYWSAGRLREGVSYWHERNWVRWRVRPRINYVATGELRGTPFRREKAKGVTEGSESTVSWPAVFATVDGVVESLNGERVVIKPDTGARRSLRLNGLRPAVPIGERVQANQILASAVSPFRELACPGDLPSTHVRALLSSRERTQRFTGVKVARLISDEDHQDLIGDLERDPEEDVYIRLEAAAYLAAAGGRRVHDLFARYLASPDDQTRLEAVIALGEVGNEESTDLLSTMLGDGSSPYFLRSAATWCLGRVGGTQPAERLIRAFADVDVNLRDEALESIASIGGDAIPVLLAGLADMDESIAAGCAEALRRKKLPEQGILELVRQIRSATPPAWAVWLLGNLPRETVAPLIADLQDKAPGLHYALALLWAFTESWVARRWELVPRPEFPA